MIYLACVGAVLAGAVVIGLTYAEGTLDDEGVVLAGCLSVLGFLLVVGGVAVAVSRWVAS